MQDVVLLLRCSNHACRCGSQAKALAHHRRHMALGGVGTTVSHAHELDSSNGVVVSEGGVVFFGALQNPCPNILVLDVLEVLDAMAVLKPKRYRKPERGDLTQSM